MVHLGLLMVSSDNSGSVLIVYLIVHIISPYCFMFAPSMQSENSCTFFDNDSCECCIGVILFHFYLIYIYIFFHYFCHLEFSYKPNVWCIRGIKVHKYFYKTIKTLSHFWDQIQLINIQSRLGEVILDISYYKSL